MGSGRGKRKRGKGVVVCVWGGAGSSDADELRQRNACGAKCCNLHHHMIKEFQRRVPASPQTHAGSPATPTLPSTSPIANPHRYLLSPHLPAPLALPSSRHHQEHQHHQEVRTRVEHFPQRLHHHQALPVACIRPSMPGRVHTRSLRSPGPLFLYVSMCRAES